MTYLKQLLLSIFVLIVVALSSLFLHPGADGLRIQLGLSEAAVEPNQRSGRPGFGGSPLVVTADIGRAALVQNLEAVGDGRSLRSAELTTEVSGRIVDVFVVAGDQVAAGDLMVQLDDQSERIALSRAQLQFDDVSARLARVERMAATAAASEAELRDARSALRSAQLQLQEAELVLARRQVVAPFSGVVSSMSAQIGHWVTPQTIVARVDDRSRLQVAFRVPERFLSAISVGQSVRVTTSALSMPPFVGRISELDGRLDTATRTLSVLAEIDNPEDVLRPGMSFQLSLEFVGSEYFSVPPLAIQWELDGPYVWVLNNNQRVSQVPVQIMQRRGQDVLVSGDLQDVQSVVIEGVQSLRPGLVVTTEVPRGRP